MRAAALAAADYVPKSVLWSVPARNFAPASSMALLSHADFVSKSASARGAKMREFRPADRPFVMGEVK
jgi:hypothetical protein